MKPLLVAAVVAMTSSALADVRDDARARFEQGQLHYNLGKLDEAIVEFDAAYKLDPDPAYLFNLAQAYRLKGNDERALFFYRRYIDLKPDAPNLADVRERIAALTEKLAANKALEKALADKAAADKALADRDTALASRQPATPAARKLRLELEVGAARVFFQGPIAEEPDQMGARFRVAYMKTFGKLTLDFGVALNYTTVPYIVLGNSQYTTYNETYVAVAADYPLVGPLTAQVVLGVGFGVLGSLVDGNGLTKTGKEREPTAMIAGDFQLALAYRIDPAIDIIVAPLAFSIARASNYLDDQISSIVRRGTLFAGLRIRR